MIKKLSKYSALIIFFLMGLSALQAGPGEPANRYFPGTLGDYEQEVAAAFFLVALLLAAAIRRHEAGTPEGKDG